MPAVRICANPVCFREVLGIARSDVRYCSPKCRRADEARKEAMKRFCANPECGKRFLPRTHNQKYCCPQCQQMHYYSMKGWKTVPSKPPATERGKWGLENCGFETGEIVMYGACGPDGGRWPDAGWGF